MSIKTDKEFCQLLYEIAINAYSKFSVHPNPKEALEICLLRMLTFNPLQKLNEGNNQKKDDIPEKKNFKKLDLEIAKPQNIKVDEDNDILKSNEDWLSFFNKVEMSSFARNYFGNMSFKSYKDNKLTLIKDDQIGEIPENIILEFKSVIKNSFKIEVELLFEVGNASNSPLSLKDIEDQKDLDNAQKSLHEDQDIKEFIKKYNGRIKTETVKPIK